jgi:hypothetical protein
VIGISESDQSIPFRRKRSYRRRSEGEAGTNRNLYLSLAHGWIIRQLTVRAVATPSRRAGDTNQPVDVNEPLLPNKPTNNLPTRTSFGPLVVSETSVPTPQKVESAVFCASNGTCVQYHRRGQLPWLFCHTFLWEEGDWELWLFRTLRHIRNEPWSRLLLPSRIRSTRLSVVVRIGSGLVPYRRVPNRPHAERDRRRPRTLVVSRRRERHWTQRIPTLLVDKLPYRVLPRVLQA